MPVLVPHLIWEAVLFLMVVVTTAALLLVTPATWEILLRQIGLLGLTATALALSLRTRTPNLAVAGIAGLAGAGYAELVTGSMDAPPLLALVIVLALMLPFGLLLGLIVGATSVPAWAVSLGGLAAAQAVLLGLSGTEGVNVPERLPAPLNGSASWFVVFLLISLGGGAVFAIPAVRRLAGPGGEPRPGFSGRRLLAALLGMGGSSVLAGLAGVAYVHDLAFFQPASFTVYQLLMALAAVLIGGISAFGGRGGIAGTVLGVALVSVVGIRLNTADLDVGVRQGLLWGAIAIAIVVGALISRLLEAIAPQFPDAAPPPLAPPPPLPQPAAPPPFPSHTVATEPAPPAPPAGDDPGGSTEDDTREKSEG